MHILITGATGYVGSNIIAKLLKCHACTQVIAAVRTKQQGMELQAILHNNSKLSFRYGSLPEEAWDLQGIDALIHCAAVLIGSHTATLFQSNVEGTRKLLEKAKQCNLKRVIYISSQSVYGASRSVLLQEDMPAQPASMYALTKLAGEMLCLEKDFSDMQIITIRLARIYGHGLFMHTQLLPHHYAKMTAKSEALPVFIHNQNSVNYLHITDMVDGVCKAAMNHNLPKKLILNLGNTKALTSIELVAVCQDAAQICKIEQPTTVLIPKASNISISSAMDIKQAKVHLDWSPQITMLSGMLELIQLHLDA